MWTARRRFWVICEEQVGGHKLPPPSVPVLSFVLMETVVENPPSIFFRLPENGVTQRRRIWHTSSYIVSANVKSSDPGHARQITRLRQVTSPHKKVWMLVKATTTERLPWNFQRLIQVTVFIKYTSKNYRIGLQVELTPWIEKLRLVTSPVSLWPQGHFMS